MFSSSEVDGQYSHVVPGGAEKADQFLSVVRDRCNQMQIGFVLEAAQRSRREGGGNCLKGKLGNGQFIEVFADPMGPGLHVGYQVVNQVAGGQLLGNVGSFRELNNSRARRQNKSGHVRQVQGMINGFEQLVLGPVIQELTDAVQQGRPAGNGFLGA